MERMLCRLVALLVLALILLAGPFVSTGIQERIYTATRESTLSYTIVLTTNGTLQNATFFIPLPATNDGASPFIEPIGNGSVSGETATWNYTVFGANNETMLKLWREGSLPAMSGIQAGIFTFSVKAGSPPLHTRDPLQYDYTLLPKRAIQESICPTGTARSARCYQYETLAYASYESSPETEVRIESSLMAVNRWQMIGNHENGYLDTLTATFRGPVRGWHTVHGILTTSRGEETPFWEEEHKERRFHINATVNTTQMRWHALTPLP
jgi:hypothetical protein